MTHRKTIIITLDVGEGENPGSGSAATGLQRQRLRPLRLPSTGLRIHPIQDLEKEPSLRNAQPVFHRAPTTQHHFDGSQPRTTPKYPRDLL